VRCECFPGTGNFLADLLKLAADLFDLGKGGVGGGRLGFKCLQSLPSLLNLPLQGVVLLLGDLALLELLVCLFRCRFEGRKLFLVSLMASASSFCFCRTSSVLEGSSFKSFSTSFSCAWVFLTSLLTPASADWSLVVSPPMDTVMPFRSRPPAMDHPSFLPTGIYSVKKGASG